MRKTLLKAVVGWSLFLNFSQAFRLGIFGGEKADIANFPYMAAYLAGGKLRCGATIISDRCAITAGHCVADYFTDIKLRVGSTFKDSGGRLVEVERLVTHPHFDKLRLWNDFAIVIFKEALDFNSKIQPVELPDEFQTIPDGTKCKVCGWGKMQNEERPRELRSIEVSIVNQETCQNNYNTTRVKFLIMPSMICAGVPDGSKDACSGDSGGPMVCNNRLFGDVSSGYKCGLPNFPGIYGRISEVISWIKTFCDV